MLMLQWEISTVNMLYSGHLCAADTDFKNQLYPICSKPYDSNLSIADIAFLRTNGVHHYEVSLYSLMISEITKTILYEIMHHYLLNFQSNKNYCFFSTFYRQLVIIITLSIYRKIPNISPGLIFGILRHPLIHCM